MKKLLITGLSLLCAMTFFTACSNEDMEETTTETTTVTTTKETTVATTSADTTTETTENDTNNIESDENDMASEGDGLTRMLK